MKRSLLLLALFAGAAFAAPTKTDAPAAKPADAAEQAKPDAEKAEQPAAEGEEKKPIENTADKVKDSAVNKVQDATLRLRKELKSIDEELRNISKPSRSLVSACNNATSRVTRSLADMDKLALEVADLEEQFRQAGSGDYTFEEVSADARDAYARDGAAAYKAMERDMKEKKKKRKVGGLDKFEIMRDRYQGVPEYKQAYDWYLKTLKSLSKSWKSMQEKEKARRKNLPPAKKEALTKADEEEMEKLEELFSKDGEDIATVWYTPSAKNEVMLRNCVNKVEDALRRNKDKDRALDPASGTVPALLTQFWEMMDNARHAMITGDLEGAEDILKNDASFKLISRLKPALLPAEYKEPLISEHNKLLQEIQKRSRAYRTVKANLERKGSTLERMISAAQAQIDSAKDAIARESDIDAGDKTAEKEDLPDTDADEDDGEEGAEGGAETPAEGGEAAAPEAAAEAPAAE